MSDHSDYSDTMKVEDEKPISSELISSLFTSTATTRRSLDDSPAYNFRLIAEVKNRPFLYDHTDEGYNMLHWRNAAWVEIAECLNTEQVKTRWKTLRDRFKKEEKKERVGKKASSWGFHESLRFIQAHLKDRFPDEPQSDRPLDGNTSPLESTMSMIEAEMSRNPSDAPSVYIDTDVKDSVDPPLSTGPPPPKRGRPSLTDSILPTVGRASLGNINKFVRIDDQEDEMFGMMIAMRLRKLEGKTKELAKMNVLRALFDAQYGEDK